MIIYKDELINSRKLDYLKWGSQKVVALFTEWDSNNSLQISEAEFERALASLGFDVPPLLVRTRPTIAKAPTLQLTPTRSSTSAQRAYRYPRERRDAVRAAARRVLLPPQARPRLTRESGGKSYGQTNKTFTTAAAQTATRITPKENCPVSTWI